MGISLAGAVGNLLTNYEAGKEKQAAIQRQTAQQTLQNAVAQQRLDLEQQQHQDTENQTLASLMQQGWTPQQPTLNAAPPLQTGMAGGINPAPAAPTTAPDPNAMSVNIGGKALYLPGASSKPAQRTAQIQALIQTFKSRYGQDLDPALAAYYHDTPAALDTAVKAMETANKPDKTEPIKAASPDWTTLAGGPVFEQNGKLMDADGKPLTAKQVKRYVAPQAASGEGSWQLTPNTKNGVQQEFNGKLGTFRDVPPGIENADKDNPQMLAQGNRIVQGAATMLGTHPRLKQFEEYAAKNPQAYTGWDAFQVELANEFSAGKVTNTQNFERSQAMQNLAKTNKPLAMYIRDGLGYAYGEGELQQRTTDFRTRLLDYIGTIGPGMDAQEIGQVTQLREDMMRPALEVATRVRSRMKLPPDQNIEAFLSGKAPGGPNAPAPTGLAGRVGAGASQPTQGKQMTQAQYDAARAAGYTDADLAAKGLKKP